MDDGRDQVARLELPPSPSSVSVARGFVRDALARWGCPHIEDDAVLVTSELVTNAVVHAGTEVRLVLSWRPPTLRGEVLDGTPSLTSAVAEHAEEHGRGLVLVDKLVQRWGVAQLPVGKAVWFELTCPT